PAVSVPLGDFFGASVGELPTFENALFSSPEARSFTCVLPMPYRTGARITITNDSDDPQTHLFYDIDFTQGEKHPADMLYFHAHWRRERWTTFKEDFEILPKIKGAGRFLGCNVGVLLKPGNSGWWGEGEVKVYLDGDLKWPTLVGTGLEDYIGTGWGLGTYANMYQGCPIADHGAGRYSFYRYHVPDPIYFDSDCRVTIQQIGGGPNDEIAKMKDADVKFEPVSVDSGGYDKFTKLYEERNPPRFGDKDFPGGHVNVYRQDDYAATAFFYLGTPTSTLPKLAPVKQRIEGLEPTE
ncbi:MAG: glycoside hydrolase family 172 protein, partial [Verrucomicrobiota bacterium]